MQGTRKTLWNFSRQLFNENLLSLQEFFFELLNKTTEMFCVI